MRVCVLLVLMLAFEVQAQNNPDQPSTTATESSAEEKRRPSWSQGLPERQAAPTTGSLITKPTATIDAPDLDEEGIELDVKPMIDKPQFDLEFQPKPAEQFVLETEPKATQERANQDREALRQAFFAEQAAAEEEDVIDPELLAQYKWQVLRVVPVEVPNDFDASQALNLNLQINPSGRVVAVRSEDNTVSGSALRMIEKSIKKWRFEPPKDIGITSNISRSFDIDIQAD